MSVDLDGLVRAGLRAPSGDNSQPWQVRIGPDGFDLRFVLERGASIFDVNRLASRMAAGAFLENVRLAAAASGLRTSIELDPDPGDQTFWARVTLEAGASERDDLALAIAERHTNRDAFDRSSLADSDLSALASTVSSPVRLRLIDDRNAIDEIAALAGIAERIRCETERAHVELQRWLRFSPKDAEASRDGLDVRTLGVNAPLAAILRLLGPWRRARSANRLGWARLAGVHGAKRVASSSALGLLTVPDCGSERAMALGASMQRVWLRATRLGLAFCPITPLPLLTLRVELLEGSGLSPAHVAELRRIRPVWRTRFGLERDERALFLFRLGRARPADTRALRRAVEDVTVG